MKFLSIAWWFASILLAPLLIGIINRTKAFFAGRKGQPLFQVYYDLLKLFQKDAVYSRTTTWIFRTGPVIGLGTLFFALAIIPLGKIPAIISFPGDLVFFAYLFGLGRFFTVLAALDTGSSFEGMGASREAQFSVFAELAFFLSLVALAVQSGKISISGIAGETLPGNCLKAGTVHLLTCVSLMIVFLAENARVPVDDPNTHLELTMIHEVMVLDHGGIDFGLILYGSTLKFWVLGALLVNTVMPFAPGGIRPQILIFGGGMALLAVLVGVIESSMARLRLYKIPQFLMGAAALAIFALGLAIT